MTRAQIRVAEHRHTDIESWRFTRRQNPLSFANVGPK